MHALARAGMRLADAAGLDAVSMRTVSADMGMSSMALYRYVKSKQELLLMMVDEACGPPPATRAAPARAGERAWWPGRTPAVSVCARTRGCRVPMTEPAILPYQVQWTEWGLGRARGYPAHRTGEAVGPAAGQRLRPRPDPALTRFEAGAEASAHPGAEAGLLYGQRLLALADPDRYPRVTAAMKADPAASYQSDFGTDEFNFGLSTVLDGIQALIARRGSGERDGRGDADGA